MKVTNDKGYQMNEKQRKKHTKRKSIFRFLFVPLILVMLLQTAIFYLAAMYGGIEESLSQNAADILNERLSNRKNELETSFNNDWTDLANATEFLDNLYADYTREHGNMPFLSDSDLQVQFLSDSSEKLIETLRHNMVNGVYLILNDKSRRESDSLVQPEQKYGLCIRDMDQTSNYSDVEDLLLERSPSALLEKTGCSLDSWWEAQYIFTPGEDNRFYFNPMNAAWDNPDVDGEDIAYLSEALQLNGNGNEVICYSLPLISADGYPYGVLGIELTTKYLATLLPGSELSGPDESCYVLAMQDQSSTDCIPVVRSGALYNRCFERTSVIDTSATNKIGGFNLMGRGDTQLYGAKTELDVYNNNNPFESRQLMLVALVENDAMFAYIDHIRQVLFFVAMLTLLLGIVCILLVSRHFASPITALAKRVRNTTPEEGFELDRLGITEIDQLVDSIENLNRDVSKNIARTEFFSRMSHDMRTPMNAIISFSSPELLENADATVKDNYLEQIHSSGEYLLGLINEVLDMTKIESKKTDLQLAPVPIGHTWKTIIPIVEKLAQKKNVTFTKDLPDGNAQYVLADEQHLSQIILNLLSNAVKFTPEHGEVQLQVHIADDPAQPDTVLCDMVIKDNGIGISEEFMKDLYTPFEQEHEGREGTGLGLSIAKKLVELMNGTIQCESTKGVGTTFTLQIPLQRCEELSVGARDSSATMDSQDSSSDSLEGKRILVCEDHPMNTQIICRLLERKGIQVVTAVNGQEGLNTFIASDLHSFDGVLMDIRMPVMDGLQTAAAIRKLDREDAATIPILAMTANAFDEDVRASRAAGMNAHLSKPIEPPKLYSALEQFLLHNDH